MNKLKDLKVLEMNINIVLNKDILVKDLPEQISAGINYFFTNNDKLKSYHKNNKIKLYSHSLLYPIEKQGLYFKDKPYSFKIRFIDLQLASMFYSSIRKLKADCFKVLSCNYSVIEKQPIEFLYTRNPLIICNPETRKMITMKDKANDLEYVKSALIKNTNKKLSEIEINSNKDFIEEVSFLGDKYTHFYYFKDGLLLGNKYEIKIKQDEESQNIAYMLIGCGLAEKTSLSFGFVNFK